MSEQKKYTLSVVYIAKDEAWRMEKSLKSVLEDQNFADEVILLDTGSTDETVKIAEGMGVNVFSEEFQGFGITKQSAISKATSEWVLSIDCDEVLSEELRNEIKKAIRNPEHNVGYEIPRQSWFLGKAMKHGGWEKDYVLRLFKNGRGKCTDDLVHERIVVEGPLGRLNSSMEHHTDPTMSGYLQKIDRYTTLAAQKIANNPKKKTSMFLAFVHGNAGFIKKLILKEGWKDGPRGVLLAVSTGYSLFLRYVKAHLIRQGEKDLFN